MISKEFRNKLMFRWSVVSTAAIALFWTGWYLIHGSVPMVTEVKITEEIVFQLPFGMSRWWDVLLGPIFSAAVVYLLASVDEDHKAALVVVALVAGLFVGFFYVSVAVFGNGFVSGIDVGIIAMLGVWFIYGLRAGIVAGLGVGIVVGLGAGIVAGLGAGFVFGFFYILAAGLGLGFKRLFRWLWLMHKEEATDNK